MSSSERLTAAEAAERLGVKPASLYAYVSRGLIERQLHGRRSTFAASDIDRLARTSQRGRFAVRGAGGPEMMFETAITMIDDGQVFYRGCDVIELSRTRTFEEVAWWLWSGDWPAAAGDDRREPTAAWPLPAQLAAAAARARGLVEGEVYPIDLFSIVVAVAATADGLRHDLSKRAVMLTGKGIIALLVDSLPVVGRLTKSAEQGSIAARLWPRLTRLPATPKRLAVLNAALVMMADHELAPSTLAARVAAMNRANPYAVIATGLGPSSGLYHAANATEVESLLADALSEDVQRAMGSRLRHGRAIQGFGQRLYPTGDPRGAELLRRLPELAASRSRVAVVDRMLAIAEERQFAPPNAELGLGALSFLSEMVPGASQGIAVLARTAGWIAHAIEEYGSGHEPFRTRAVYLGPAPAGS